MQVVIFSRNIKDPHLPVVQRLFDLLHQHQITTFVYADLLDQIEGKIRLRQEVGRFESHLDFRLRTFDFVITLGGDGTILGAVTLVRDTGIPILGINLGRLGFLASIETSRMEEAILRLLNDSYYLDERTLLQLDANLPLFNDFPFALNDFTLLKRDTSSMIVVHTWVNGAFLNTYWADGVIMATPTGSTGYSLSCGGPIIFPDSRNFVLTPVAPHNLNVRPIVLSDDAVVSFEVEGRTDHFLCTLDSRYETITARHRMALRLAPFRIRLVRMDEGEFLETIRRKLAWGIDKRNA